MILVDFCKIASLFCDPMILRIVMCKPGYKETLVLYYILPSTVRTQVSSVLHKLITEKRSGAKTW